MSISDDGLDKDERKRLETLVADWNRKAGSFIRPKDISAADLRLLLNHFRPLQDLIRTIAGGHVATDTTVPAEENGRDIRQEERIRQALKDLEACTEACRTLQAEKKQLQRELQEARAAKDRMQEQTRALEARLAEAEKIRRSAVSHPVLAALQAMPDVARQMELTHLPDTPMDALLHVVAVLAARDNLERLWDALAGEAKRLRSAPGREAISLLEQALAWHNCNWKRRPWQLDHARPGSAFDFTRHQRAPSTPTGDVVDALWLPALLDGSGKPVRKALVTTR